MKPNNTFLIIGLGNPGPEYQKTRHNLGFWAVDQFAKNADLENPADQLDFQLEKKHQAQIKIIKKTTEKIILAKPETFMNLSGKAVLSLVNFHKILPENLLVIHDELDLPLGQIRFSQNSSPAGHNGVSSIIQALGTQDFARLRIGIKTDFLSEKNIPAEKFVLQKFSSKEQKAIESLSPQITQAILSFLQNGFEKSAGLFN